MSDFLFIRFIQISVDIAFCFSSLGSDILLIVFVLCAAFVLVVSSSSEQTSSEFIVCWVITLSEVDAKNFRIKACINRSRSASESSLCPVLTES